MPQARILIVEDDPDTARLLENWLLLQHYQVVGTAATGQEALQLAQSSQPDLVIMDIMLPGGLDGIQTAHLMRERDELAIIYLTAYSNDALFQRARETRPAAYLTKPFNEHDLTRAIEVALDRHHLLRRLKESESHLAEAQAVAHIGSWRWDVENDHVMASNEILRLLGLTPGSFEPCFDTFLQRVQVDDQPLFMQWVEGLLAAGKPEDIDLRFIREDGAWHVLRLRGKVRRDHAGQVCELLGTARDVTDEWQARREAEQYRARLEDEVASRTASLQSALEQLRQSESRYRSLVEVLPEAIFVVQDNRIVYANPAAAGLAEVGSETDLLGQSVQDLLHPDSMRLFEARQHAAFKTSEPNPLITFTLTRRDGSSVDVESLSLAVAYGGLPALLVIVRDISQRKQSEQRLIESEANLARAQSIAKTGSWELDLSTGQLAWSNETCRIFGVPAGTVLTLEGFFERIHPEDREPVRMAWSAAVEGTPYDIEHRILVDGSLKWVREQAEIRMDADGRPARGFGSVQDITERKQAELNLRRSEARSRSILRAAPVGIGVLVDRVFQVVNDTMTRMTGYEQGELVGRSARMLYPTQDDYDFVGTEKYRQIHAHGVGAVETRWLRKDGRIIDVLLSSAPIVPNDLSQGVTFTALDITDSKQAEQARLTHEENQRNALVREVHHRIKNNLQGVIGLLRQHIADHPGSQVPIEAAIHQINTVAVVHGLQGRLPHQELRLRELLLEVCNAATALALALTPPTLEDTLLGEVWLDSRSAVAIALILNELIHNALKHGNHQSPIGVTISLGGDATLARVHISNANGSLPEHFDIYTGQGCGTGLGLVRTLLPIHGAQLNLYASKGRIHAELILTPPVISSPDQAGRPPGQTDTIRP